MVKEVKTREGSLIFSEWKTGDPKFMWCRELTNTGKDESDHGAGIVLLCFDDQWSIRFFSNLLHMVVDAYNIMYPYGKKYASPEEAKEDVDKFLFRVNSLKLFL